MNCFSNRYSRIQRPQIISLPVNWWITALFLNFLLNYQQKCKRWTMGTFTNGSPCTFFGLFIHLCNISIMRKVQSLGICIQWNNVVQVNSSVLNLKKEVLATHSLACEVFLKVAPFPVVHSNLKPKSWNLWWIQVSTVFSIHWMFYMCIHCIFIPP